MRHSCWVWLFTLQDAFCPTRFLQGVEKMTPSLSVGQLVSWTEFLLPLFRSPLLFVFSVQGSGLITWESAWGTPRANVSSRGPGEFLFLWLPMKFSKRKQSFLSNRNKSSRFWGNVLRFFQEMKHFWGREIFGFSWEEQRGLLYEHCLTTNVCTCIYMGGHRHDSAYKFKCLWVSSYTPQCVSNVTIGQILQLTVTTFSRFT